jgi:hypothetical protein
MQRPAFAGDNSMRCRHKNCRCDISPDAERAGDVIAVLGEVLDQQFDFSPTDTAEPGNADAIIPTSEHARFYCSAHCAEMMAETSEDCGCGHELCSQKEPMFTTRAQEKKAL